MAWTNYILLFFCACLQESRLSFEAEEAVFLPNSQASAVLQRSRRFNSLFLEELLQGNLERECREEKCSLEEAREIFENDEQTMQFWALYTDGDQCLSSPCRNGGQCKDGVGSYSCSCQSGFTGTNCEIGLLKKCDINNGGCMHFCMDAPRRVICDCAFGYKLAKDGFSCKPKVQVPCGTLGKKVMAILSQRATHPPELGKPPDAASKVKVLTSTVPLKVMAIGPKVRALETDVKVATPVLAAAKQVFETKEVPRLKGDGAKIKECGVMINATTTKTVKAICSKVKAVNATVNTTSSQTKMSVKAAGNLTLKVNATNFHPAPLLPVKLPDRKKPTASLNHTRPSNKGVLVPRIVGGHEALPGEIPWQVALIDRHTKMVFCGGSILSEWWVVTAAHCLTTSKEVSFFIRVGEHTINKEEGTEQNVEVGQKFPHPLYDPHVNPYNHDIALLRVRSAISLTETARPICVGPQDFTEKLLQEGPGDALVSGWGRLQHQGATSQTLQKVTLPFVERSQCKASSGSQTITRHMFCSGYSDVARDACQGDSGGPHASRHGATWFLTGIVSWGEECAAKDKYGIYTRVSHFYRWIANVTGFIEAPLVKLVPDP